MDEIRSGLPNQWAQLHGYRPAVESALDQLAEEDVVRRIWERDHTVWHSEPDEVADRLGWLGVAAAMRPEVARIQTLLDRARSKGLTHALLLGMGGSSLAPEMFAKTFGGGAHYLDLTVLDSTDPEWILAQQNRLPLERTLCIVATKSGGTTETMSLAKHFYNRAASAMGNPEAASRFVAITDPGSALARLADELQFGDTFLNDPNIGGRYSALSYFGMVPAALVGADVGALLDEALAMALACSSDAATPDNPGTWLGAILATLALEGRDKLTIVASEAIDSIGDWIEQLIAESTGKDGLGILPVVGEELRPAGNYGDDRLFVEIHHVDDASRRDALQSLAARGHPVVRLGIDDINDLGGQLILWELATAVAGHLMGINPFDQPNVEEAKVSARQMVERYKESGELPVETPTVVDEGVAIFVGRMPDLRARPPEPRARPPDAGAADGGNAAVAADTQSAADALGESGMAALQGFLAQAEPGDYIVIQAFIAPSADNDAALRAFRDALNELGTAAVTVGYGPRYLHSTGQLHKGDGGRGLFVQLTADTALDVPIPDQIGTEQSSVSFGVLKLAQAIGDRQALAARNRRTMRIHLGTAAASGIERLVTWLPGRAGD